MRLSMSDPRYAEVFDWLVREAELLDNREFEAWLGLLTGDVAYRMPVRQTLQEAGPESSYHFLDENYESLWVRLRRLIDGYAVAEIPPSRTRRHVSNIRVATGDSDTELEALSYLLLLRSRGDDPHYEIISCERRDRLRRDGSDGLLLASREILVDQSVLNAVNLAALL